MILREGIEGHEKYTAFFVSVAALAINIPLYAKYSIKHSALSNWKFSGVLPVFFSDTQKCRKIVFFLGVNTDCLKTISTGNTTGDNCLSVKQSQTGATVVAWAQL